MNDIKFRAWDKENRVMAYSDNPVYCFVINSNGTISVYLREKVQLLNTEPAEVYTGRKDINGAEIYKGDILNIKIHSYLNGQVIAEGNAVVEFRDDRFGILWGVHKDFTGLNDFTYTTFEIVGNIICENPDLLLEDTNTY